MFTWKNNEKCTIIWKNVGKTVKTANLNKAGNDMSVRRKKKDNKSVYRSLAMITQFGINMLVPICIMSLLGIWLDRRFDTSFWMILLFFVGAVAGGQNIYRMAKQIYAPSGQDSRLASGPAEGSREKTQGDAGKE